MKKKTLQQQIIVDHLNAIKMNERINVLRKYDGKCAYCGVPIEYETFRIDHISPKCWFRHSDFDPVLDHFNNLNPSCQHCNKRKGSKNIEEFRQHIYDQVEAIKNGSYQIAERFGLVNLETFDKPIVFWFERF